MQQRIKLLQLLFRFFSLQILEDLEKSFKLFSESLPSQRPTIPEFSQQAWTPLFYGTLLLQEQRIVAGNERVTYLNSIPNNGSFFKLAFHFHKSEFKLQ